MTLQTEPVLHPRPVVVVIGELGGGPPPGLDRIAGRVEFRYARTRSELDAALPDAEAALLWDFGSPLLAESLRGAVSLRWIHVAGAGVDAVLTPALVDSEIALTNAHGVFDRSVAETVAGMLLVFVKDVIGTVELQQSRQWRHRETEMLAGQTALVVGAGGIGREIARVLAALAVDVTVVASSERTDAELGVVRSIDDLDELLGDVDFVVLVLPLTDDTRDLFDADRFRLMKRTARLVNVGRGELVDEEALVAALRSGEIAGAALDVFREEPLPTDHPLWALPNVLVSPHMSADFRGWLDALADQFIENLERWLDDRPLVNVVGKRRGYVPGNRGHDERTA